MDEQENSVRKYPVNTVRFGLGKEIRLYDDELVVKDGDDQHEVQVPLAELARLTLIPGDPQPSKLVLIADLKDGSTEILAEGMSNARDFREMIPLITERCPDLELDPPDMRDQLWQALNNKRAWSLTCYGTIILICLFLYGLYLLVAFLGTLHH